ncbi:C2 family cysteine protease [Nocardia salmonicida]
MAASTATEYLVVGANGEHWVSRQALTASGFAWDSARVGFARTVTVGGVTWWERESVVVDPRTDRPGEVLVQLPGGPHWLGEADAAAVGLLRPNRLPRPLFGGHKPAATDLDTLPGWPVVEQLREHATRPAAIGSMLRFVVRAGAQHLRVPGSVVDAEGNRVDDNGDIIGADGAVVLKDADVIAIEVLLEVAGEPRWVGVDRSTTLVPGSDQAAAGWPAAVLAANAIVAEHISRLAPSDALPASESIAPLDATSTSESIASMTPPPLLTAPMTDAEIELLVGGWTPPSRSLPRAVRQGAVAPTVATGNPGRAVAAMFGAAVALPLVATAASTAVVRAPAGSRPTLVESSNLPVPGHIGAILLPEDGFVPRADGVELISVAGPNGRSWVSPTDLAAAGYRWQPDKQWYARPFTLAEGVEVFEHDLVVVAPGADATTVLLTVGDTTHTVPAEVAAGVGLVPDRELRGPIFGTEGPKSVDLEHYRGVAGTVTWPVLNQLAALVTDPAAILSMTRFVLTDGTAIGHDDPPADSDVAGLDVLLTVRGTPQWVRVDRSTKLPIDWFAGQSNSAVGQPIWPALLLAAQASVLAIERDAAIAELTAYAVTRARQGRLIAGLNETTADEALDTSVAVGQPMRQSADNDDFMGSFGFSLEEVEPVAVAVRAVAADVDQVTDSAPSAELIVPADGLVIGTGSDAIHLASGDKLAARWELAAPGKRAEYIWVRKPDGGQWHQISATELAGRGLVMPRLAVIDADVFGAQISAADVVQGGLGTCYLHAGLSAMAFAHPDWVRQMIDVNPETGAIAVRFVRDGVEEWVPVDRRFYVYETGDGGRMAYALAEPGQPLWPALVEKARAIHQGGALGYAGIVGGNSGAVATALRPVATVTSQGRAQPSRGVDDGNFAHPMTLGADALADLIIAANDSTVTAAAALAIAHTVLDLEPEWLAWTKSWLSPITWNAENALRRMMGHPTIDRETWLRTNNVRTGIGFRTFLAEKFGRDWATAQPVLEPVIALMTTWESGTELDDTHAATRVLTRWAGDRVKALLTRGDFVMVATNSTPTGARHPRTDLQPDHAYTVLGLRSDPTDPSYVTHLLLRDPNGTTTELSVRHFNQLVFISSAGPATQFVLGDGELALTVLPSSIQTRQPWAIDPATLLVDQPSGARANATAVAHTVDIVGALGGRQRPRPRYQRPPKLPADLDTNGSLTDATTRARQAAHWWERHGRAWWTALRFDELADVDQYRLVTRYHRLRKSDGLPIRVRDTMNRSFLRHESARLRASTGTGSTATEQRLTVLTRFDQAVATADAEAAAFPGRSAIAAPRAFLLRVEPSAFDGAGSLVLSIGNPVTASVVSWHVPGASVAPATAANTGVELYAATAQELAGRGSTATIVWLDRAATPEASVANWIKSAVAAAPRDGKARLEAAMGALRTGRVQRGGTAPHIEVFDDMWGTPSARSSRTHSVGRPINHSLAQPRSWSSELTMLGRDRHPLFGPSGRPDARDLAPDGVEPHAAALRALIARHPGWVGQLVRERADGNFEVVFHRADGTVTRVAVDRQFAVVDGNADYRVTTAGQPLWPAVIAKALAVYHDNEPAADLLGESPATETDLLPGYRAGEPTAIPAALTPPHGWNPAGQLSSLTGTTHRVLAHPMYLSPELLRAWLGSDLATVLTTASRGVAPVELWRAVAFLQSEHDVWEQARAAFASAPDPAHAVELVRAWLGEHPGTADRAFDQLLRAPRSRQCIDCANYSPAPRTRLRCSRRCSMPSPPRTPTRIRAPRWPTYCAAHT